MQSYISENGIIHLRLERENAYGGLETAWLYPYEGQNYVEAIYGRRYTLCFTNLLSTRIEIVVSVDGLDILSGKNATMSARGYILAGTQFLKIEGFRTSLNDVATFRFTPPEGSYASLTGRPQNIGVIGIAAYKEKVFTPPPFIASAQPNFTPEGPHPLRISSSSLDASPERGYESMGSGASRGSAGTQFGEQRQSRVQEKSFIRNSLHPDAFLTLRYEVRATLEQMGIALSEVPHIAIPKGPHPFPADAQFCSPPPLPVSSR